MKDVTDFARAGGTREQLEAIAAATPEWVAVGSHAGEGAANANADADAAAEDGSELLADVYTFVRRFVVLAPEQIIAIALWMIHTYLLEVAETTPYLSAMSAEKRSGKTRLLETCELVVKNPWMTGRTSAAALARKVDHDRPTLLLDESDAAFGGDKEYAEVLRGVLNTGHRRGGAVTVCVGKSTDIKTKDFSTFGPKMIAGIGKLPDTVTDRSITITLRRRAPGEDVERFRRRKVKPDADALRERIARWAAQNVEALTGVEPDLPAELDDRQQDAWEPLLAIADRVGGDWPARSRDSAKKLSGGEVREDSSVGVRLLADCRRIFGKRTEKGEDRIATVAMIEALCADAEAPWCEWTKGKPITAAGLARLLKPFGVASRTVRVEGGSTPKGYVRESFEDAWTRYLSAAARAESGPASATTPQPNENGHETTFSIRNTDRPVADAESGSDPMFIGPVALWRIAAADMRAQPDEPDDPMFRAAVETFRRPDGPDAGPPF